MELAMRAYSRRHRRALRNRNAAPLMLVADGNSFADVFTALGRLLFRYRSELAPFTTALVLAAAGELLHSEHPKWWPYVAGVALVLAGVIAVTGAPFRAERRSERVYATAAVFAAGGWLTAAAKAGPFTDPLPTLLGLAVLAAGLPWWTHRRRRMRVTVDRTIQAWPDIAEQVGLKGSHVLSAVVDVWGWRARIALRGGQTVADVVAHVPAIESGLGTRPGAVRVEPDPAHAGRATIRVLATDPHAEAIPWSGPSVRSITQPITLGVFEDATPVRVSFLRRHGLLGGIAGSGKSGILNVIVANLAACADVVLWGIDLKGGMELRPWISCLDRLATTPAEATQLQRDAVGILEARAKAMGEGSERVWNPSPQHPALIIITDEYAELAENAPLAADAADSVARRGRALAVTELAATQRPTQKAMGKGALRSQMDIRIALRVRERRDTDLILGQGMLAAGWHAHTLDAPGKFLISAEGLDHPRRARGFLVTDEDVATEAARWAPIRPPLDDLSAAAVGTARDGEADGTGEVLEGEIVDDSVDPESALWTALREAPDEGLTIPELIMTTGMQRTWIYLRLQQHARTDRAVQVSRCRWRATDSHRERPAA
jgi:DNA segregation ATPase FtsK/SpoIIIE, S-DNA-T family